MEAMLSHNKNNVIHGLTFKFVSLNVLQFLFFFYFSVAIVKTLKKDATCTCTFIWEKKFFLIINYLEIIRSVEVNLRGKILHRNIYIQMSTLTKLLRWVSQNYLLCFGSKILWFRFFFYWAQLFVDFVFKTIKTMKCFERNPQNNYKLIILILSNIYCSWMFVPLGVVKATKSTQKIEVYYFIVDHNK